MSIGELRPFTSESVTEGHPDKLCDRVSDAILDEILDQDRAARVAVEVVATKGLVHVVGEINTNAYVEIPNVVREEIVRIGYDSQQAGFDGNSCGVSVAIGQQSPDISAGVDESLEVRDHLADGSDPRDVQGAGDQGIMFGFASDETPDLMPAPIWLAQKLAMRLAEVRKLGIVDGLLPDGKTQVTLLYEGDRPVAVDNVVVSSQHVESLAEVDLRDAINSEVIDPVFANCGIALDFATARRMVNPSGRFVLGGPAADAGLTGRKIIVDTYGGSASHGGGAFSGKDPSKVDRSASYAARWIAKNVVAAGLAKKCKIQLAYAIGSSRPVSITIDTYGTGVLPEVALAAVIEDVFDLRPLGIIEDLRLLDTSSVHYRDTAAYGHFGRPGFSWEEIDRTEDLLTAAKV